ncbi:MAG: hypothetical protein RBS99_16350 [Rhodospirillales bacterium]|nr:hypothetical protein [Rhodospirillales bacterium]
MKDDADFSAGFGNVMEMLLPPSPGAGIAESICQANSFHLAADAKHVRRILLVVVVICGQVHAAEDDGALVVCDVRSLDPDESLVERGKGIRNFCEFRIPQFGFSPWLENVMLDALAPKITSKNKMQAYIIGAPSARQYPRRGASQSGGWQNHSP